jgi:hypothetical protein
MPFAFYAAHHFDSHIWDVMNPSSEILSLLDLLFTQSEAGLAATLQLILVPDDNVRRLVGGGFRPVNFSVSASTIVYATRLFEMKTLEIIG